MSYIFTVLVVTAIAEVLMRVSGGTTNNSPVDRLGSFLTGKLPRR
jgi:hypothetical protein